MSYLDESGLSAYDSNLKEWISSQESKTITSSIYPWAKTVKASIVSCYPVGDTKLKPIVDFLFSETPPASGDKGPDNPSTITGVSEVTVKHRTSNLLYPLDAASGTTRDVNWSSNGDGSFTFNGTVSSNSDAVAGYWVLSDIPKGTYRIKLKGAEAGTHPRLVLRIDDNGTISYPAFTENSSSYVAFTVTDTKKITSLYFRFIEGYTFNNITVSPYLVLGDEDYDIPLSDSYTIPLGSTYYGGTLDVASGVMTVTWWGHVFDGTETWRENGTVGANYRHWVRLSENGFPNPVTGSAYQRCSHCTYNYSFNASLGKFFANSVESGGGIFFDDKDAVYPSTESWVNWIASEYAAGHPVVVTYQLTTPYTVQLSPTEILSLAQPDKYTPRLNTVYTDASAVQVGYVKSPIRDEYELTQAIVSQGGNI